MLERAVEAVGAASRTLAYIAGLILLVAVISHGLTWLITRRRTAFLVWGYWNRFGAALLAAGILAIGYGWWALGLQTPVGSAVIALGLLLASAGLWMLIPI
jgi:hypothetical protein